MKIGNRLEHLRRQQGKTQTEVVEELTAWLGRRPFTRQMLSHWETGRYHLAGEELAILCQYYRVTPGDILVLEESGRQCVPA
jgi:transcriptional regulator with XRE-family HTH domain